MNTIQKYATKLRLVFANIIQNTKLSVENMSDITYHKHSDSGEQPTA